MYRDVTEGKFIIFDKKTSKTLEVYYLEPCLYPSIPDFVETINVLLQERQNHSENLIKANVSRRTQKIEVYPANEGSGLALFSMDLGTISEVMLVKNLE